MKEVNIIVIVLFIYSGSFILWVKFGILNKNIDDNIQLLDIHEAKFNAYIKQFNKTYMADEYGIRLLNFKASLKEIKVLNALEGSQVFGLNRFSDMSKDEFAVRMGLYRPSHTGDIYDQCTNKSSNSLKDVPISDSVDWRSKGYVSPILDQKLCLGCWAFSIVGVMETMSVERGFPRQRLSIQELLDCSLHNKGCEGGNAQSALEWLCMYEQPITTEEAYPLTLSMHKICRPGITDGRRIAEYRIEAHDNEEDILRKLNRGPVIAVVAASTWIAYTNGVIHRACKKQPWELLVHDVQIVGYNKSADIPYYIIRNSWGDDWGNDGYVYVKIGGNVCNIADQIVTLDVY